MLLVLSAQYYLLKIIFAVIWYLLICIFRAQIHNKGSFTIYRLHYLQGKKSSGARGSGGGGGGGGGSGKTGGGGRGKKGERGGGGSGGGSGSPRVGGRG